MLQSNKRDSIDYLKGFAAIFVVLHHAILYAGAEQSAPVWQWLLNMVMFTHVPLFFAVAGYLCHKQDFGNYIRKKALRILVPFFLFSSLKLVYSLFISNEFAHGASLGDQLFSAFVLGSLYWFPYAIVLCYCFAVFFWTGKKEVPTLLKKILVPGVLVCLIIVNCRYYLPSCRGMDLFQLGNAIRFFVFFLLGMMIRQHEQVFSYLYRKYRYPILAINLPVMILSSYLLIRNGSVGNYPVELVLGLATMVVLLFISKILPRNVKILKLMGKYSLQIMFFDSFNKIVLFALLPRFIPMNLPLIVLAVVLNLLITCIACQIIERIPRLRTLFGL